MMRVALTLYLVVEPSSRSVSSCVSSCPDGEMVVVCISGWKCVPCSPVIASLAPESNSISLPSAAGFESSLPSSVFELLTKYAGLRLLVMFPSCRPLEMIVAWAPGDRLFQISRSSRDSVPWVSSSMADVSGGYLALPWLCSFTTSSGRDPSSESSSSSSFRGMTCSRPVPGCTEAQTRKKIMRMNAMSVAALDGGSTSRRRRSIFMPVRG